LEIRKPDFYTVILPNSTPVTVLRPEAKKAAAFKMPKVVHSDLLIDNNGRAPAEAYAVTSRKLKDKVKNGINIEKLLIIIMST
jgi:hypothetical protein